MKNINVLLQQKNYNNICLQQCFFVFSFYLLLQCLLKLNRTIIFKLNKKSSNSLSIQKLKNTKTIFYVPLTYNLIKFEGILEKKHVLCSNA